MWGQPTQAPALAEADCVNGPHIIWWKIKEECPMINLTTIMTVSGAVITVALVDIVLETMGKPQYGKILGMLVVIGLGFYGLTLLDGFFKTIMKLFL